MKKHISINVPETYIRVIDILKNSGVIESQSGLCRDAIMELLDDEILFNKKMEKFEVDPEKIPKIKQVKWNDKYEYKSFSKPIKEHDFFERSLCQNYVLDYLKESSTRSLFQS